MIKQDIDPHANSYGQVETNIMDEHLVVNLDWWRDIMMMTMMTGRLVLNETWMVTQEPMEDRSKLHE